MTPRGRSGPSDRPDAKVPANHLYHGLRLPHAVSLPVLGVPVEFASNSLAGMDAVEQSFGMWRRLVTATRAKGPPSIRVRVIEQEGDEGGARPARVSWRMPDNRRIIGFTAGSLDIADFDRGEVVIYVTTTLLADRTHFCYSMLEALTLTTVNSAGRLPVHAGALVRGNAVVLLAGPSGQGKSTLVYTAMRAGYRVLADDAVYVQLRPRLAFWGVPRHVYLLPDARRASPEGSAPQPSVLANGKRKIVIATPADLYASLPVSTGKVAAVLLQRSEGPVSLEPVGPATVEAALAADTEIPLAQFGKDMREAIRRVARRGGWRLRLSRDPTDALPLLEDVFDQLDRPVAAKARGR